MGRREHDPAVGGAPAKPFPSLADIAQPNRDEDTPTGPLDICVVTSEILGPIKNGGIGTATSALAEFLASQGHRVTVLFTQVQGGSPFCQEGEWSEWVESHWEKGIRLIAIKHNGPWNAWREKSWAVRRFLESEKFSLVYLNEHHASGFYAQMAKRAGVASFQDQTHVVITHGSMEWVARTNDVPLTNPNDIAMALMERRSLEWADMVIGPSAYLLKTYQSYGWQLPAATYVQPYLLGTDKEKQPKAKPHPVQEIVFFGRLEHRKGLWMFCEALDRLAAAGLCPDVTFMGRMTRVGGVPTGAFLLKRAEKWPFKVKLLTDYGQEDALTYLGQPGVLAVMPSLADNSPCVVYECIEKNIPFLTCSGSGADEIIDPRDQGVALVEPTATALAERLEHCLNKGSSAARLGFVPAKNRAAWQHWHQTFASLHPHKSDDGLGEPTAEKSEHQQTLILFVDEPSEPLGPIFESLAENAKALGPGHRFVFLTPRAGSLGDWIDQILDLIAFSTDTVIARLNIGSLAQALDHTAICAIAPVTGRLKATVMQEAVRLVSSHQGMITSFLPAGRPDHPIVRGHSMPYGDIAPLGLAGEALTGGACVGPGPVLSRQVQAAAKGPQATGDWPASETLSEDVVLAHLLEGGQFQLIPQTGLSLARLPDRSGADHWHMRATGHLQRARQNHLAPGDLPIWMAVSSAWERKTKALEGSSKALTSVPLIEQLTDQAAAAGRMQTAIELAAGQKADRIKAVKDTAVATLRAIPAIDFLPQILNAAVDDTATGTAISPTASLLPTALMGSTNPATELQRRGSSLHLNFPAGGDAQALIVAFDIAVDGHSVLQADIERPEWCESSAAMSAEMVVLDQSLGTLFVPPSEPVDLSQLNSAHLSLGGVHARLTLILTISVSSSTRPSMCEITALYAK